MLSVLTVVTLLSVSDAGRPLTDMEIMNPSASDPSVPRPRREAPVFYRSRSSFEVDFQMVFPGHSTALVGGSFRFHLHHGDVFWTIAPEVTARNSSGLTIVEPGLAFAVGKVVSSSRQFAFDIGMEAAALGHLSSGSDHMDGRLGIPIAVTGASGRATITVMPYARLAEIKHSRGNAGTYTSEHWGILLRVGIGL